MDLKKHDKAGASFEGGTQSGAMGKTRNYRLGMPFWGFQDWVGNFYRRSSKPRSFLRQYSQVFGAVEGNTTFYHLPSEKSVARWRADTPASFRFCFKLPRRITHELSLVGVEAETHEFFRRLEPLGERLGLFMVQLPATFGPERLDDLNRFLGSLPSAHHFGVELRHASFWSDVSGPQADDLLRRYGAERILMDTRALREGDPDHPDVAGALHKKPDLAVVPVALGPHPMLRWVGHPDEVVDQPWLEHWADVAAGWIGEGREPYVMIHVPNNVHSPPLARTFHDLLRQRLAERGDAELGPLPPSPAEAEGPEPEQLSMF